MKTNRFIQSCTRWVVALLLLVGVVPMAKADQWGHEKPECFSAYEKGPGVIHFKLLVTRKPSNTNHLWLASATNYDGSQTNGVSYITMSRPGMPDERIVEFYSGVTGWTESGGILSSLKEVRAIAKQGVLVPTSPIYKICRKEGGCHEFEIMEDGCVLIGAGDERAAFFEFDWYTPYEMIGSNPPASFAVHLECKGINPTSDGYYTYGNVQNDRNYDYSLLSNVSLPNSAPELPQILEPQMAMDMGDGKAQPGQMMLNVVSSQEKIFSYHVPGMHWDTLTPSHNLATIYIPISDEVRTNYPINLKLFYNGDADWLANHPSIRVYGTSTEVKTANLHNVDLTVPSIPAYHQIHNLKAEWKTDSLGLKNGDVRVSWEIQHPNETDIMENDMFIIERDTNAQFTAAQQIGMLYYEKGKANYEYIDESDDVKRQDSKSNAYYYRVRRASTSMWTDTKKVVASGLAAEAELSFDHAITSQDEYKQWMSDYLRAKRGNDLYIYSVTWTDGTHARIDFAPTISPLWLSSENFRYATRTGKAIYQPVVGACSAAAADDWASSRKVNISATIPYGIVQGMKGIHYTSSCPQYGLDDYACTYNVEFAPAMIESNQPNVYWDKERTILYLVRRMIVGNDTTEVDIPVSNNDIQYNSTTKHYEVRTTDVADIPCTRYEYYFRTDASNSPLPLGGEAVSQMAEALSQFYFNDGMHISSLEASDRTSPDFTQLKWETVGGDFESYEVWRTADTSAVHQWSKIATVQAKSYLDRKALIGKPCLYKVVGLLNCDGTLSDTSAVARGVRDCYGSVSGYVTYTNGTARPGTCIYIVSSTDNTVLDSVMTDAKGYYYKDSLWFCDEGSQYDIQVAGNDDDSFLSAAGTHLPLRVSLDGWSATLTNINIQYTQCKRMEGRVLYEYSTVPVPHAHFRVDGRLLTDIQGNPIETDASGNFDLMVESGLHTIQVEKDGHTFRNNGFFTDEDGSDTLRFDGNKYEKRMYDTTRIRVAGRVTGGLTEGTKPLGLGRSVNTLGDNLTLVFELEGDNISRFVYYPTHTEITERDMVFHHLHAGDSTTMHMEPKRITVHPDPRTGEYMVELFPARYKVTQAYATGYATLFPAGMTSQAIDMSDATHIEGYIDTTYIHQGGTIEPIHQPYHYRYQITYRNPIRLNYQQLVYGMPVDYLGDAKMAYENALSRDTTISLLMRDSTGALQDYVFGYPLFNARMFRNRYTYRISATEDYYYNGNTSSTRHWQEYITGHEVTIFNGMNTDATPQRAFIDPVTRYATVEVEVNNPSFVLTGESALRQIEMGVQVDGQYVYAEPIRGYVSGSRTKGIETLQTLGDELTLLDIIRDPYGANSYSYVESGSKYHASYSSNWDVNLGLKIGVSTGPDVYQSVGLVTAPMGMGGYTGTVAFDHKTKIDVDFPIQFRFVGYSNADYEFTTSSRIQTSSDPSMVGAMADIYVGTMHQTYAGLLDAVTIIDSVQYRMLQPAIRSGKVHLLSEPHDSIPYYLVVGEQTELGMTRPVEFVYTQKHILDNVLPRLLQQRDALLMEGSHAELQAVADSANTSVYRSLVAPGDTLYGLPGGYEWIPPTKMGVYVDEVNRYNHLVKQWIQIITQNEKEKDMAMRYGDMGSAANGKAELLQTYSVTSGADISYSESSEYSHASDWHWRWKTLLTSLGSGGASFVGQAWLGDGIKALANYVLKAMGSNKTESSTKVFGFDLSFSFSPIIEPNTSSQGTATFTSSKSAGFELSTPLDSYEDISVYRLKTDKFDEDNKGTHDLAYSDISSSQTENHQFADFVFFRRGGATRCPYADEETTLFLTRGNQPIQLAAPTLHIDRPTLSINVREQSNVPMDQPATFVLTLSNESDLTYDPNLSKTTTFILAQDHETNANGLVIMVDGLPLGNGLEFYLAPNQSLTKTIQVYRGTAYDYEDVSLTFFSDCNVKLSSSVTFNVHYQPVSCPVTMTLPVQNWIMNTLSPRDDIGYYLPVEISGFDTHYDNFDHIDLQYKLKTQSDDQWTTQCSYYADSALYALASGNKAMIENGIIRNVRFYGERDPMEQHYDLRAVSYCRFGNEYIYRTSELRSGLKDTRLPQLFGTATPADGILQVGDYISIPFSENIAANYLDADYNFEVVGYTNQSKKNETTSLTFEGKPNIYAVTKLTSNLSKKDFSVDMFVMPDRIDREMTYFMQGNEDTYVGLGQSYDPATGTNRLAVHMADQTNHGYVLSEPVRLETNDWMHVVATYSSEDGDVEIYLNGNNITDHQSNYPPCMPGYDGVGMIVLGAHPAWPGSYFEGQMLEVRVWNKVMNEAEVKENNRRLTGYENGLVAYYTFDEGQGETTVDKVNGQIMLLNGPTWTNSEGRALALKNQEIHLDANKFIVSENADFTYAMWFRVYEEVDSINLFSTHNLQLSLTPTSVILSEPGMRVAGQGQWMDGYWHYLAVTSNHSTGVANLYIDADVVAQFNSRDIQGPDSEPVIGPMTGEVDDITFWEMALPDYYLQNFYRQTPNNTEMGLVTHLSFSERVLSEDGDHYYTRYNPYNERIHFDELGNVIPRSEGDRVVLTEDSLLANQLVDNAPIHDKGDLVKLGFNWIGKDNELVINLKTLDKEINKQNIFITVRNVEDLAGNPQKSPMCWTLFVDLNQLRWSEKYLMADVPEGESLSLPVDLINQGGTSNNFYIDKLPAWLTASAERGSLSPLEQRRINLRVSDKLDPGEYQTTIYLADDNDLCEPLLVTVHVRARRPNWSVDTEYTNGQTMNLFGQVQIVGAQGVEYLDSDTADIIAAYLGNTCIGVDHLISQNDRSLLCMSLQGNNTPAFQDAVQKKQAIRFLLWRASSGKVYILNSADSTSICYAANTWVGSPDKPILLRTTEYRTQQVEVEKGWNWISFYIDPDRSGANFSDALTSDYTFHNGDFIKWAILSQSYEDGEWHGMPMQFFNTNVYMIRVSEPGRIGVLGTTTTLDRQTVNVRGGWNHLPYICEHTQDINTALTSYRDHGKPGDVVKSYHSFAMMDENRNWIGSLTHMQPGLGYMLYRQDTSRVTIQYVDWTVDKKDPDSTEVHTSGRYLRYSHNMPIVATVAGAQPGDMLVAYEGNEPVGSAVADSRGRFMLMTSAGENSRLSFRYRSAAGEQQTTPIVAYQPERAAIGTVDQPYLITFGTDMATVYPSPFTDHITYSGVTDAERVEIDLYSIDGRHMWRHTLENPNGPWQFTQTDTEGYPQGVYVAVIRMGDTCKQVKLIKE